jgi:hypothetical protein
MVAAFAATTKVPTRSGHAARYFIFCPTNRTAYDFRLASPVAGAAAELS